MKSICLTFVIAFYCSIALSQNIILNGSFENNTAAGDTFNLTSDWQNIVMDSWSIDAGRMNLLTTNGCGPASNGNWFVTNCSNSGISSYMSFSFKLIAPIFAGDTCTISFDKKYCGLTNDIEIQLTNDSTLAGMVVHTFTGPSLSNWAHESAIFQSPFTANYIIVNANINFTPNLLAIDNFRLNKKPCDAYYTLEPDITPHNWTAVNLATGATPMSYVWHWGDGDSSTIAYPSHQYATSGNYNICLTVADATGCIDTYCDSSTYLYKNTSANSVVNLNVTGPATTIPEIKVNDETYDIYPNPSPDKFVINSNSNPADIKLSIYNEFGKKIYSESISEFISKEIDLKNYSSGIYLVRIIEAEKQFCKKLILQHNN